MTAFPQRYARVCGALYLLIIAIGIFGEVMVRGKLIAPGDPATTTRQIMASPLLFRTGIAGDLLMHLLDIPCILIFYVLLRPVSRPLSLLAAFFNLAQTSMLAINKLTLIAVATLLSGHAYAEAFTPHQLQSIAYFFLDLHENGFGIGLLFFACRCLIVGYLIVRSSYFPGWLGVFQIIAGLCYLINSFALVLSPSLAAALFPGILLPAFIGELAMALWLLVKGVNVLKWKQSFQ